MRKLIPVSILIWIVFDLLILCLDAFYVINRPQTLAGGKYYHLTWFYELYVYYDPLYGMNDDYFVMIQAWMSFCEAIFGTVALLVYFSGKKVAGTVMSIICQAMTFWKTVLFMSYDNYWITPEAHAFTPGSILLYYIPDGIWLVMPFIAMWVMGSRLSNSIEVKNKVN